MLTFFPEMIRDGGEMSLSDFSDLEAKVLSTIEGVLKKVKFLKEYGHFYKMFFNPSKLRGMGSRCQAWKNQDDIGGPVGFLIIESTVICSPGMWGRSRNPEELGTLRADGSTLWFSTATRKEVRSPCAVVMWQFRQLHGWSKLSWILWNCLML